MPNKIIKYYVLGCILIPLIMFGQTAQLIFNQLNEIGQCNGCESQPNISVSPNSAAYYHESTDCQDSSSVQYHPNQYIASIGDYKKCMREGHWVFWDSTGNLSSFIRYKNGLIHTRYPAVDSLQTDHLNKQFYNLVKSRFNELKELIILENDKKKSCNKLLLKHQQLINLYQLLKLMYRAEFELRSNRNNRIYKLNYLNSLWIEDEIEKNTDLIIYECNGKGEELIAIGKKCVSAVYFDQGVRLIKAGIQSQKSSEFYLNLYQFFIKQNSEDLLPEAENLLLLSQQRSDKEENINLLSKTSFELSKLYFDKGEFGKSLKYLDKFHELELNKVRVDSTFEIREHYFDNYFLIQDFRRTEIILLKYFDSFSYLNQEKIKGNQAIQFGKVCWLLGQYYYSVGNLKKAMYYCQKGMNISERLRDSPEATLLLADCFMAKAEIGAAIRYYNKTISLIQAIPKSTGVKKKSEGYLGCVFSDRVYLDGTLKKNENDKYEKEFKNDLILFYGYEKEVVHALYNLALIRLIEGDYSKGFLLNLRAINLLSFGGSFNDNIIKHLFAIQGYIYEKRDEISKARKCYNFVVELHLDQESPVSIPSIEGIPGGFYFPISNDIATELDLNILLNIMRFSNYNKREVKTNEDLISKVVTEKIKIFSTQTSLLTNSIPEYYYSKVIEGLKNQYLDYMVTLLDDKSTTGKQVLTRKNIFEFTLAIKSVIFQNRREIVEKVLSCNDSLIIAKYKNLQFLDNQITESRSNYLTGFNTNIETLQKEMLNLEQDILKNITVGGDKGRQIKAEFMRESLSINEAVIEFIRINPFLIDKKDQQYYLALIITTETIISPKLVFLKNGKGLEEKHYNHYQKHLTDPKLRQEIDWESYNHYWASIDSVIGDKKVIYVSADGVYNKINLETMVMPDGKYLGGKYDIRMVSSTRELIQEKPQKGKAEKDALIVANPQFEMDSTSYPLTAAAGADDFTTDVWRHTTRSFDQVNLTPLPASEKEAENISALLQQKDISAIILTGNKAVEETVKAADSPSILHIATHGYFAEDVQIQKQDHFMGMGVERAVENPMLRSGLLLSGSAATVRGEYNPESGIDNGILTAYEVQHMNLDSTELVVLSACETGLGEIKNGEGVYGLQRAFRIAGAEAVLMSLWKVDDAATEKLMTSFYEYWLSGESKREALRRAKNDLKKSRRYNHPFYWGAFVLIGE